MLLSFQAAAANRRLKEALAKQKLIQAERANRLETYNSSTIGNRVRVRISVEAFWSLKIFKLLEINVCISNTLVFSVVFRI